ncbi:triose-phosphate isomerase family protein [Streptomyces sp. NPDC000880]
MTIEPAPVPPLFVGVSLKMYFDHLQTVDWCRRVADQVSDHPAVTSGAVELVVLPTAPSLAAAAEVFRGTRVRVGGQNLFWSDSGPYTGETGGPHLRQVGCDYVEIGHSERRRMFHEDDGVVALKMAAALRNGLTPLLCVGEETRGAAGAAAGQCVEQLESATAELDDGTRHRIVVAYEPVWAIGAEQPAPLGHVAEVAHEITAWLDGHPFLKESHVIYGGSAGPGLLSELGHAVDGLFLGRFAHRVDALGGILDEALRRSATEMPPPDQAASRTAVRQDGDRRRNDAGPATEQEGGHDG